MADLQLKRLEAERDRLQAEFKTLNEAISTREACEECVRRRVCGGNAKLDCSRSPVWLCADRSRAAALRVRALVMRLHALS